MLDPSEASRGAHFLGLLEAAVVDGVDSFAMASFVEDGRDTKKLFTVCLHCSTWVKKITTKP